MHTETNKMAMSYINDYRKLVSDTERFKKQIMDDVVAVFKTKYRKPITIGNMVYYICKDRSGNDVPAYCYKCDWDGDRKKMLPIYDSEGTHEFGWYNFDDVAKILDVIMN